MAKYTILRDDEDHPVEARVELEDGRIACAGVQAGQLADNPDIPPDVKKAIRKELG